MPGLSIDGDPITHFEGVPINVILNISTKVAPLWKLGDGEGWLKACSVPVARAPEKRKRDSEVDDSVEEDQEEEDDDDEDDEDDLVIVMDATV